MQILPRVSLCAIMAVSLLSSCANVTFIGHERAYDLNVALKADLTSPVSTNLGFESKTGLAVPPQNAMFLSDLVNRLKVHDGDVLPTVSRLSAKRVNNQGGFDGVDYVSVIATGNAAVLATAPRGATVGTAAPAVIVPGNTASGAESLVNGVSKMVTGQ